LQRKIPKIILYNFTNAVQQHHRGNVPFRLLQDMAAVQISLCAKPHVGVWNSIEITTADIEWLSGQPEANADYMTFFGGNFHVCQNHDDLLVIEGCDLSWVKSHDGKPPNVTNIAMSWDSCNYLAEPDGNPQWAMFLLCTNNAGGPVYYVPKPLWELARVEEHIAMTHDFWKAS
jgi:hypothetical protein